MGFRTGVQFPSPPPEEGCYLDKGSNPFYTLDKKTKQVDQMILFRPVGTIELNLIKQGNYTEFPPRLPEQPIFYPVLKKNKARILPHSCGS